MKTNESLNVVQDEKRCDQMKSQDDLTENNRVHDEQSVNELQALGAKVGDCDKIVNEICKHLPKLLIARLVNKKWCAIASNILRERSNIWIRLSKQVGSSRNELKSWSKVNPTLRNNSKLIALDRLLAENSNFPCQNYWISVGVQGSSGSPSMFISKWIDRIKSLHFDTQTMPFVFIFGNFMPTSGFVPIANVKNLQIEHGPYDWGLPRETVRSDTPKLDRLKKLTLSGNYICNGKSWREVLLEAVNLERIENCTLPYLPEIIKQNKTSLVKSLYLNFFLKPNPAVGLTLQENVNVFVQAVQQGLTLEDILSFNIELFISPRTGVQSYEKLPSQATLIKLYRSVVQTFNRLLKNSEGTLQGVRDISCLGYTSKDTKSGGCLLPIEIPCMTKMREIDWLTLDENPLMKFDLLFPLENEDFSVSRYFPNVKDVIGDPSKECWTSLALKSRSDLEQLTKTLSMPSATRLFWFCNHLDSIDSIIRNRNCGLIQHFLHPIFPNLVILHLEHLKLAQIPNALNKIFQFYSNTLQELYLVNHRNEVASGNKSEMWCLDVPITGLPQSFLNILRENFKNVQAKTVQLLLTSPSIRSMQCLKKLKFRVFANRFHSGSSVPLISELSQLYGFEFLPKLKTVTIDNADNVSCPSDDESDQEQEFIDARSDEGYYQRYRFYQRPKEQNIVVNVDQKLESLESQMEEQRLKDELLFLKKKIEEKLKCLKYDSEIFKELKSVLHDVTRLLNNI